MKARIVMLAAAGLPLLAAYTYFYTDTLTSINGANWYSNGTVTTSASGLNASSANGGTVISKVAIPDATANYEVKAKLRLTQDGGNYTLYLRASNDAWLATPATGSFYAVELQSPVISNGVCSATLAVYKQVSGNTTQLTQTQTTCHDNLELHAVIGGSQLIVYADNVELVWLFDGSLTTGKGGVGGRGMPAGNGIAHGSVLRAARRP